MRRICALAVLLAAILNLCAVLLWLAGEKTIAGPPYPQTAIHQDSYDPR